MILLLSLGRVPGALAAGAALGALAVLLSVLAG